MVKKRKKRQTKKFDWGKVQDAAVTIIEAAASPITLSQLCAEIHGALEIDQENTDEPIADYLYGRLVDDSGFPNVLSRENVDENDVEFVTPRVLFKGMRLCAKPSSNELAQGILFPGHRFLPCYAPESYRSFEITLRDGETKIPLKTVRSSLKDAWFYYSLFGASAPYEMLEDDKEASDLNALPHDQTVRDIAVFDLADYYRRVSFKEGDLLTLQCDDFDEAQFSIGHITAERLAHEFTTVKRWSEEFEGVLLEVFDRLGPDTSVAAQLAQAFFIGGEWLMKNQWITIGSLLGRSKTIGIAHPPMGTILWEKGKDPMEDFDLEGMVEQAKGKRSFDSPMDELLSRLGIDHTEVTVGAYMKDELFKGGKSFDNVLDRLIGEERMTTVKKCFPERIAELMTALRGKWEAVKTGYNRFADNDKGKIRTKILAIKDKHVGLARSLDKIHVQVAELPASETMKIAKFVGMLEQLLQLMDNLDEEFGKKESEEFTSMLSTIEPAIDATLRSIYEQVLSKRK